MRTKRKRGYYRALKRGKEWAIKLQKLEQTNPLQFLFAMTYSGYIADLIPNKTIWTSIYPKSLEDSFYYQPVILGIEHGVEFKEIKLPKKTKKKWLW